MATVPLVVTDGLEATVDALDTYFSTPYIGTGTGSTAAAAGDAALETEVETRAAATASQPSATVLQMEGTISITGTRALRECGLLTLSSGGVLFMRAVHDVVNLVSGDSMTYTIQITPSDNS